MAEWASLLAADRAWVVHVKTATITRCGRFWSGVGDDVFHDGTKGLPPARGPVLEMEDGQSFFATKEDDFRRLTDDEVRCYQVIADAVPGIVAELANVRGLPGDLQGSVRGDGERRAPPAGPRVRGISRGRMTAPAAPTPARDVRAQLEAPRPVLDALGFKGMVANAHNAVVVVVQMYGRIVEWQAARIRALEEELLRVRQEATAPARRPECSLGPNE